MSNFDIRGIDYIIDLNGQQVDNAYINGAVLFGVVVGNGGSLLLETCKIGDLTTGEIAIVNSAIAGDIITTEAGTYFFDSNASAVAGAERPGFSFDPAVAAQFLNVRHHSGGWEINDMREKDKASVEGHGQLVVNGTGGQIEVRGHWKITDNSGGAVTIDDSANYDAGNIAVAVWSETVRTLTSFGSLVADVAAAVWGAVTRTLTAGTKDTEIDAILEDTGTTLPGQIDGVETKVDAVQVTADAILEDTGTTLVAQIDGVETKVDAVQVTADAIQVVTDALLAMTEIEGAYRRWLATALEEAPGGGSGGGTATLEKQEEMILQLDGIEGEEFRSAVNSLFALSQDINALCGGSSPSPALCGATYLPYRCELQRPVQASEDSGGQDEETFEVAFATAHCDFWGAGGREQVTEQELAVGQFKFEVAGATGINERWRVAKMRDSMGRAVHGLEGYVLEVVSPPSPVGTAGLVQMIIQTAR